MEGELCNDFSVDWFPPELRQKAEELEDALVSRTEASLPADELAKKAEIRRAILAQLDELPDKEQKNLVLRYFLAVLEGRGSKLSRACLHDSHDESAAKARKEEQLEGEEAVIGEDFLCNDCYSTDIDKEIKNKLVPPDTGSLSYADFVALYYSYMDTLCRFHTRARREGLLALDEELENIENEFFHLGLQLLVDGIDGSVIRSILSNYIAHETDYYKRILKQIIMEGVLYILDGGGSLEILIIQLNSMVSIKNNIISEKTAEYLCGDIHALDNCFDNIPSRPAPEEREEIVFIKRAFALSEKSRRDGLLALEQEIDKAAIASGDIFEYGLTLSIDGEESAVINSILGNLVAHESDPVKKNLCEAKKEALLSIHAGDNPRVLLAKYFSYFGDDVRQIARKLFDFDY